MLYQVASNPAAYAASFTDVRAGSNDTYGISNGKVFAATRGYDPATGLGSPMLSGSGGTAGLAYYLCSLARFPSRPAVTGLAPSSGSAAGGERVRITGSGFMSHGRSLVGSIQIGARPVPAGNLQVRNAHTILATLPPAGQGLPPNAHVSGDGAGPAQVIVTLKNGASSTAGPSSRFTYVDSAARAAAPTVAAITPSGGLQTASGTVTVLGSGFTGVRRVTFGGVRAPRFVVHGPDRITVTYPRMSAATACTPLPHTGVYKGENARNDVCQVQVRVYTRGGVSAQTTIRPPLEGALSAERDGRVHHPSLQVRGGADRRRVRLPAAAADRFGLDLGRADDARLRARRLGDHRQGRRAEPARHRLGRLRRPDGGIPRSRSATCSCQAPRCRSPPPGAT